MDIERRKLSDEVLDRLLQMIELREVEPGNLLPSERDLMARFEVGRPAVREALQALESMGIVQIHHGSGARLLSLGPENVLVMVDRTVRHLLSMSPELREPLREARLAFEGAMAQLAAEKRVQADIDDLCGALHRQRQARGDVARFVAADMEFHNAIARISGNAIYIALSQALLQWVFEQFPRLLRTPGAESLTLAEHQVILDAIVAKNGEQAVAALRTHLLRSNPLYGQGHRVSKHKRAKPHRPSR